MKRVIREHRRAPHRITGDVAHLVELECGHTIRRMSRTSAPLRRQRMWCVRCEGEKAKRAERLAFKARRRNRR